MPKILHIQARPFIRILLATAGLFTGLSFIDASRANQTWPLPLRKPQAETSRLVNYTLKDFRKASDAASATLAAIEPASGGQAERGVSAPIRQILQPIKISYNPSEDGARLFEPVEPRGKTSSRDAAALIRAARRMTVSGGPDAALRMLFTDPRRTALTPTETDTLKGYIAQSLVYSGKTAAAESLIYDAVARSGKDAPVAAWVGGLSAWASGDYGNAAQRFATAAQSDYASTWMRSAASFWTARAAERSGNRKAAQEWLEAAAREPQTFYGLLAIARLNNEDRLDVDSYPRSKWKPEGGYRIDPALIDAIVLQESRLDPKAVSPSGAHGLMQLLPSTACTLTTKCSQADSGIKALLAQPETNLALGQKYLIRLLNEPSVNGDLIKLMVAYNAGPGNLAQWQDNIGHIDDSLLFMELLPLSETRAYVERVLANYWLYRLRDGRDLTSLKSAAAGQIPLYDTTPETADAFKLASR